MAGPAASRAHDDGPFRSPLRGRRFDFRKQVDLADRYAAQLLSSLGADASLPDGPSDAVDAARDWAQSGLLPLIGYADGPPLPGPAALASCANGALRALRMLSERPCLSNIEGASLLSERAAYLGLQRRGQMSANGTCRLLRAADDWIAVNLAREADWDLLPAWLETNVIRDDWDALAATLGERSAGPLVERGRLLGLPVAAVHDRPTEAGWFGIHMLGTAAPPPAAGTTPLVVDLSSLWAGPLCSHLLQQTGARIIKVESKQRPDAARGGNRDFFDLLNAGKASVILDFKSELGRRQLRALLQCADIIIESSRPRALTQLGIDAEALADARPGLVWIGITGYGRAEPNAQWIAFGDDAAVAAGVAVADPPVFCGDALADPLTGLHAALAGLAFWRSGTGALLDLSLCQVTAHCLHALSVPSARIVRDGEHWLAVSGEKCWPIAGPRFRDARGMAADFGADTARVLAEFGIPC